MASFNLANIFLFCFLIYIKSIYSTVEVSKLPVAFEKDADYLKYTLDPDTKCLGVQYDGKDVLKLDTDDSEVPALKSVYFSIKSNVAIANFEGARRLLRLEDGEWKHAITGAKIIRSINVLFKNSCEYYDCFGGNKLYSYTASDKVLFNKVRSHPGGNAVEQVMFQTEDVMDMVYEVVYDESDPNLFVATTHHLNGLTRKFTRKPKCEWKEVHAEDSEVKLTEDKVEFVIQSHLPKGVLFQKKDGYLKYSFETGVKCLGVEYEGKLLEFDPKMTLPKSLYFTLHGKRAFLNFKEKVQILKMDGNKFESVFSGLKRTVGLDIGKRSSTDSFIHTEKGKVHTFTAGNGLAFSSVGKVGGCFIGSSASVWSTRYSGEVVTKVVYDARNSENKVLTLYGVSGLTKKFTKKMYGEWEECVPKESGDEATADNVEFIVKVTPESATAGLEMTKGDDDVEP